MGRQIQIPMELFEALVAYHLSDEPDEDGDLSKIIQEGLLARLDALARRYWYTQYRMAPTAAEREEARQNYLEEIGMHRDWRF